MTDRLFPLRHLAALALALTCLGTVLVADAGDAAAQGYPILVTAGVNGGLDPTQFGDIVEESAYLTEDFGGFVVTRAYQLDRMLPRTTRDAVAGCADDVRCYTGTLANGPFDFALVVSAYPRATEVLVDYAMIDLRVGVLAARTQAFPPTPTDFAYLMVPCHDSLKVIPEWVSLGPVRVAPDPTPVAPPVSTPPPYSAPREPRERQLGQLGRIGAGAAGAGGALVLGGVLMGFAADETQQEIQSTPHPRAELETLQAKGRTQQRTANALFIVGGLAAATGVTLVIIDPDRGDSGARVGLRASGSGAVLRAEF